MQWQDCRGATRWLAAPAPQSSPSTATASSQCQDSSTIAWTSPDSHRTTAGQFVAYSVTSVWDHGTDATWAWRRDISHGKFMGPRMAPTPQVAGPKDRLCREAALEPPRRPSSDSTTNSPLACADRASRPAKCCGARPSIPRRIMAEPRPRLHRAGQDCWCDRAQRQSPGQHRTHALDRCGRLSWRNPDASASQPTVVARGPATGAL